MRFWNRKPFFAALLAVIVIFWGLQPCCAALPRSVSLCEEEAELLVRAAAHASRGSMRIDGRGNTRNAAPYAARVGIIATVLNRLADPRFPNSVPLIIASDRTFSETAPAARLTDDELTLTRAALNDALDGFDPTNGALCFSTPEECDSPFTITCEFDDYAFGVPLGE